MKLNILHIALTSKWGGGANHIQNLCKELALGGHTSNHLLSISGGEIDEKISKKHLKFHGLKMKINLDLRAIRIINRICRKEEIDLIHLHGSTALTLAVLADHFHKLPPFVFSKKTSFPIKERWITQYKYNYPRLKKILCVSEKTRQISAETIQDPGRLVTIYHGTDLKTKSTHTPFKLRDKLNIKDDKILVGTIANHIKAKNLETWIKTIDHLVNQLHRSDFHFVQIGQDTDRTPEFRQLIRELKLENHISLMGFLPNASNFIPQFDISLLTSQSEGLPQFIYESFYHKVPVVSTNVGGIPEIIEDGTNGFLCPPFQPAQLAGKLIALQRDSELKRQFTEISYKKLQKNYTTSIMAEKTLAEYKKVLYGKNG